MTRSLLPELMDSDEVRGPILDRFHRDLSRVNRLLGTYSTIARFLQTDSPKSVVDIGCGDGELLRYLRKRMPIEATGIDLKPGKSDDIRIVAMDATTAAIPACDVAVCLFVAHHLSPEQNIALIRNVGRSAKRFIILDLIRHRLPMVLFTAFICPLIGREAAVDGRQSIRRAYTPTEFKALVSEAMRGSKGTFTTDTSRLRSRQVIDIRYR